LLSLWVASVFLRWWYLQAGMMVGGQESPRGGGTQQDGPISPLLTNILLDDLGSKIECRGHAFCRSADDFTIT